MLKEDEVITVLADFYKPHPRVKLGPGDDVALLRELSGRELAVSVDSAYEDIHFTLDSLTLREVGHRALANALSDLAAAGAEPLTFLVDLQLPRRLASRAQELYQGMEELMKAFCISPAGGNITRSERLGLTTVVIGEVPEGRLITRSGARPGDKVVLTGDVGRVRAWLLAEEMGVFKGYEPWLRRLKEKYARPWPAIRVIQQMKTEGLQITAAIDLSDGLGMDAARLARASEVQLVIYADRLPIDDATKVLAERVRLEPWRVAVESGEECEVLMTVPPEVADQLSRVSAPLTVIGEVVEDKPGAKLVVNGEEIDLEGLGYDHFALM